MLQEMDNVVVLCSTAGEGDMPNNAHSFWENISDPSLPADLLKTTKVSVFGLGDTGYRHFNAAAKNIEHRLTALGAERIQETGLGNDKDEDKYETAFSAWVPDFWKIQNAPESEADKLIAEPIVKLEPVDIETRYIQVQPPKTKMLTMEKNVRITPSDYGRIIRHLVFDVEGKDFSYLLGDALTIYPNNDPAMVAGSLLG